MLGNNNCCILRLDLHIEGVVRHNLDNGSFLAEAETAGHYNLYLITEAFFFKFPLQTLKDETAFCGATTGPATDKKVHSEF